MAPTPSFQRGGLNLSKNMIDAHAFYNEYSGHPVEQLKEVIAGLRGSKESLVFLVGDSSLDNKYWLARQEAAVNGYEELLRPAQSVCDVTHFMNRELNRRDPSRACVNCAIEATTLNQRGMGRLLPQDRLVRDSIRPEDVLIVSVGGNDIALAPLLCTCCNIIPLLCCLACSGGEDDFCCCRARACPPDIYTYSGGYTDCACCCCGLPGCVVGICGWPPGLGYFVDLFGNRIRSYVSRLVSKKKPRLVVVCMIYHLDVRGRGSWADTTLNLLGYNHNPRLLQKAIKLVFERGTKGIEIQGTKVLPFPLFQVLDGSDTDDYVQRVEPSVQGGSKMAAALVDHVLAQQQAQPSSPDHHRMHARVKQRYNAT